MICPACKTDIPMFIMRDENGDKIRKGFCGCGAVAWQMLERKPSKIIPFNFRKNVSNG